ncbi:sialyltransferase-like protein 2 isoform X1 [Quercus robur]|uniref:sialyltransferase-like protein 2 isoform X1 n=1 Tax=Quercus robur TaxID=38942 RepID=UPI00216273DE|nr:sialyltransferase-like protein 2 isoform X1 [Quercus robur]
MLSISLSVSLLLSFSISLSLSVSLSFCCLVSLSLCCSVSLSLCCSCSQSPFHKLIKIHSPMRADPNRVVKWVPRRGTIRAARIASEKLLKRVGAGSSDPLAACSITKKQVEREPVALSNLR